MTLEKVALSDFDSCMDLDEFIQWLRRLEQVFVYKDVPPAKK